VLTPSGPEMIAYRRLALHIIADALQDLRGSTPMREATAYQFLFAPRGEPILALWCHVAGCTVARVRRAAGCRSAVSVD
jgi:hypothetical protein